MHPLAVLERRPGGIVVQQHLQLVRTSRVIQQGSGKVLALSPKLLESLQRCLVPRRETSFVNNAEERGIARPLFRRFTPTVSRFSFRFRLDGSFPRIWNVSRETFPSRYGRRRSRKLVSFLKSIGCIELVRQFEDERARGCMNKSDENDEKEDGGQVVCQSSCRGTIGHSARFETFEKMRSNLVETSSPRMGRHGGGRRRRSLGNLFPLGARRSSGRFKRSSLGNLFGRYCVWIDRYKDGSGGRGSFNRPRKERRIDGYIERIRLSVIPISDGERGTKRTWCL